MVQVDFARLQRREALDGGQRREADGFRVIENRSGHCAAEVDVEAGQFTSIVGVGETSQTRGNAALDVALGFYGLQRLRRSCMRAQGQGGCASHGRQNDLCHRYTF
jgi:hypothetical protein